MESFIGRRLELAALEAQYAGSGGSFVPIYGRRRVGKSELILHFIRDKPAIYFVGKTAPAALQLREFVTEAARVTGEPLLAELPADDWKRALRTVLDRWKGRERLVIALDEFQWTVGASPELPSVLQELWDRDLRHSRRFMLILCGSYVGFMERDVLGKKSPLFGRRTAQIQLKPFGFREARLFHPRWSTTEQARAYFICGGVPLYLRAFEPTRSVESSIEHTLLDPLSPLFHEPDFLLREELREVDSYYAVLMAIAGGAHTQGEIATKSALPERSLHYYLAQLAALGYVAKRHPLSGERKPSARSVHFVLEDPLLRFWFRFVFPNLSFVLRGGARVTMRQRIKPELEGWFGGGFERLCREALPFLYEQDGVSAAHLVGEYWDKRTQLDVVGVREDGWIDLGECKWGTVRSATAVEGELDAKVALFPNPRGRTIARHVFSREGSKPRRPAREDVRWHSLADLYRG